MDIMTAYMIVLLSQKGIDVGDVPADKFDAWTKKMHANFVSYVNGMIPEDWYTMPPNDWTDELPDINGEED